MSQVPRGASQGSPHGPWKEEGSCQRKNAREGNIGCVFCLSDTTQFSYLELKIISTFVSLLVFRNYTAV